MPDLDGYTQNHNLIKLHRRLSHSKFFFISVRFSIASYKQGMGIETAKPSYENKRIHPKVRFWTSTMRSNSGFTAFKKFYVSNES